ncbi:hypothetical protein ABFS82_12G027700 [Erythranthe guttata]
MEAVSFSSSYNPKLPLSQWFSTKPSSHNRNNYRFTTTRKLILNANKDDHSNEAGESLDDKKPITLRINIKKTKEAINYITKNNKDLPRGGGPPPSEKIISRYDNNEKDALEAVEFLRSYFVKNTKPSAAAIGVVLIASFAIIMSTIPIFSHESVFLENLLKLTKGFLQAGFHVYIDIDF